MSANSESKKDRLLRKQPYADWRRAPYDMGGIIVCAPSQEGVAETMDHYHLHDGADAVWLLIDGTRTEDEIATELRKRFRIQEISMELAQTIDALLKLGLVEQVR
jgi:hypothetical protein